MSTTKTKTRSGSSKTQTSPCPKSPITLVTPTLVSQEITGLKTSIVAIVETDTEKKNAIKGLMLTTGINNMIESDRG
jgi:hypothetical protein